MTLQEAVRELLKEVRALLSEDDFSREALDRFYGLREKFHRPIDHFLSEDERFWPARQRVKGLVEAVGEYVIRLRAEPQLRDERRQRVGRLAGQLQADLGLDGPPRAAALQDTGWQVAPDGRGRVSVRSPANVAESGVLTQEMLKSAVMSATAAQARSPRHIRPMDKRGQPGGLVRLDAVERLVVIGDLRGQYGHLVHILKQAGLLDTLGRPGTHLVLTGNAFHPAAGRRASLEEFRQGAATLGLVSALKAQYPAAVHYLRGNFDHSHAGGITGGPGTRLDKAFADALSRIYSGAVVLQYQNLVAASPVAAQVRGTAVTLLIVHASVPYGMKRDEQIIGALMSGPRSKILEDLLWNRRYDAQALQGLREGMGIHYVLCGYAPFPEEPAERFGLIQVAESPFAHRQDTALVVCSHARTFGFLDVDMTRPLPRGVTRLRAPDGRWAMRVISEP